MTEFGQSRWCENSNLSPYLYLHKSSFFLTCDLPKSITRTLKSGLTRPAFCTVYLQQVAEAEVPLKAAASTSPAFPKVQRQPKPGYQVLEQALSLLPAYPWQPTQPPLTSVHLHTKPGHLTLAVLTLQDCGTSCFV